MDTGIIDTLETTGLKFIGNPRKSLYRKHSASRKRFVLFLESGEGKKRLGADPNLSLIIMKNSDYSQYPIASISKYYDEFHVVINPPEEE